MKEKIIQIIKMIEEIPDGSFSQKNELLKKAYEVKTQTDDISNLLSNVTDMITARLAVSVLLSTHFKNPTG